MLNTKRSIARTGGIACPCCRCPEPNRSRRTRENRAWKRDQSVT